MLKRKIVENTAVRTTIISKGFKTDHSTPNTLRQYFSLKSLETRDRRINQSFLSFSLPELIREARLLRVEAIANFLYKGLRRSVWRMGH